MELRVKRAPWIEAEITVPGDKSISHRAAIIAAVCISIAAAFYFPLTAWHQHRNFILAWQDELSYALQIRMLAHGRLWMPRHPSIVGSWPAHASARTGVPA